MNNENISEIVNDIHCTFICNTVHKDINHNTKAEKELTKLQKNNKSKFELLDLSNQKELLAKLNIYRQAYELLNVTFIGNKIRDGNIELNGLIYNRENLSFEKLKLE